MAFSVQEFQDLVRLLEQRPEWRDQLRRLVLTEELLDLPAVVRELAEQVRGLVQAQARTQAEVGELREAVQALVQAQLRSEARLDRLEQKVDQLDQKFDRLDEQVGHLRGSDLERRYRDHAGGYFGRLLRRVRVVGADELDDLLDEGLAAGALDDHGAHEVRLADLVVRGRRPGEEWETYLVVEVSAGLDRDDVERAARRASLLGRVRPTLAAVGGERVMEEVAELADTRGVWRLLDGRILAPTER